MDVLRHETTTFGVRSSFELTETGVRVVLGTECVDNPLDERLRSFVQFCLLNPDMPFLSTEYEQVFEFGALDTEEGVCDTHNRLVGALNPLLAVSHFIRCGTGRTTYYAFLSNNESVEKVYQNGISKYCDPLGPYMHHRRKKRQHIFETLREHYEDPDLHEAKLIDRRKHRHALAAGAVLLVAGTSAGYMLQKKRKG